LGRIRNAAGTCSSPRAGKETDRGLHEAWIQPAFAGIPAGAQPAKNELFNHLGDPLDTESVVDDSELAFVLFRDALKMLFEQNLKRIDFTRPVHPLGDRGDRKG